MKYFSSLVPFTPVQVVHVRDMAGCQYSIPFNSSAKFGLVYSPVGIHNESYVFENVKDIIDAAVLPKIVVATKAICPSKDSPDHSVMKNEILIIQEVRNQCRNLFWSVYSSEGGSKKVLGIVYCIHLHTPYR